MTVADLDLLTPLRKHIDPKHLLDIARRFTCDAQLVLSGVETAIRAEAAEALRRCATVPRAHALFLGMLPLAHHCGLIELFSATAHRETELAIIRREIEQLRQAPDAEGIRTPA